LIRRVHSIADLPRRLQEPLGEQLGEGAGAVIALLFFEVLVILCLIAAITVWQRQGARLDAGAAVSRGLAPLLDAERDLAASLGVPYAAWAGDSVHPDRRRAAPGVDQRRRGDRGDPAASSAPWACPGW